MSLNKDHINIRIRPQTKTKNGLTLIVDGLEIRYHVRERDNRVAIVITKPGWAVQSNHDFWYVSIGDLTKDGWRHRGGSLSDGMVYELAMEIVKDLYEHEARNDITGT